MQHRFRGLRCHRSGQQARGEDQDKFAKVTESTRKTMQLHSGVGDTGPTDELPERKFAPVTLLPARECCSKHVPQRSKPRAMSRCQRRLDAPSITKIPQRANASNPSAAQGTGWYGTN